jgi:hypothetical protein
MPEGKLTLWKLQALVAGSALIFALIYWLFGPVGGFFMLIMLLPFWSVPIWLILSEGQANVLWALIFGAYLLFVMMCLADGVTRVVFGFGLPLGKKGLLNMAWLYFMAGLSIAQSWAKWLRVWRS